VLRQQITEVGNISHPLLARGLYPRESLSQDQESHRRLTASVNLIVSHSPKDSAHCIACFSPSAGAYGSF